MPEAEQHHADYEIELHEDEECSELMLLNSPAVLSIHLSIHVRRCDLRVSACVRSGHILGRLCRITFCARLKIMDNACSSLMSVCDSLVSRFPRDAK